MADENVAENPKYQRICSICKIKLVYKCRNSFYIARKNNTNCKSCTTKLEYIKNPNKNKAQENGRFGKSFLSVLINKYGKKDALLRYKNFSKKQSKRNSGKNNPMYGKTPDINSGKSYKGWYKGLFFRSSLELLFLMYYENINGTLPYPADNNSFRIKYDKNKTYLPDFFCSVNNTLYEIKCSRFVKDNKLKIKAANKFCKKNNYKYVIITEYDLPNFTSFNKIPLKLLELHKDSIIKLTDKTLSKINKNETIN